MRKLIKYNSILLLLSIMIFTFSACGTGDRIEETEGFNETQVAKEWDAFLLDNFETGSSGYYAYDYDLSEIQDVAEAGDVDAQSLMGDIIFFSEQSRESGTAARQWYELAAEQGDAWSQYMMGRTLEGVPADNEDEVLGYLQQAADQGLVCACQELGQIYYDGMIDGSKMVTQDVAEAKKLFEQAINGEHLYSQEYRKWVDRLDQTFAQIYLGY